jgi:hypothetical protein
MSLNFDVTGSAIVLVGSFNPTIFQPEWFARQGLISKAETEGASIKIIVPEVSHFETERFAMFVTAEKLVVSSKPNADPAPLRDLVLGTFFILEHTPVTAMGLNRMMHVALESEEAWHRFGDRLAPKDGWNQILDGRPGMQSLTILTNKTEPLGAQFVIKVEPSQRIKYGAYFETTDHFVAPKEDGLKLLMKTLGEKWEGVPTYATSVVEHILNWAGTVK